MYSLYYSWPGNEIVHLKVTYKEYSVRGVESCKRRFVEISIISFLFLFLIYFYSLDLYKIKSSVDRVQGVRGRWKARG